MKTIILTSEKFTGEVEFKYNDTGQLVMYDNRASFDAAQHDWMLKRLPATVTRLDEVVHLVSGKTVEVKIEPTFEQFWKQYFAGRLKDNSSRRRAQAKWNRMSVGERANAYTYIPSYMSRIAYGTQPKHAETYLNSELWNG